MKKRKKKHVYHANIFRGMTQSAVGCATALLQCVPLFELMILTRLLWTWFSLDCFSFLPLLRRPRRNKWTGLP